MNNPWLKCYHENWKDWACKDMDVCSQASRCRRKQWDECFKEKFRSAECDNCKLLTVCIDRSAESKRTSRRMTQFMSIALTMGMTEDEG